MPRELAAKFREDGLVHAEPVKVSSEKELQQIAEKLAAQLAGTQEWDVRMGAMAQIEGLVMGCVSLSPVSSRPHTQIPANPLPAQHLSAPTLAAAPHPRRPPMASPHDVVLSSFRSRNSYLVSAAARTQWTAGRPPSPPSATCSRYSSPTAAPQW